MFWLQRLRMTRGEIRVRRNHNLPQLSTTNNGSQHRRERKSGKSSDFPPQVKLHSWKRHATVDKLFVIYRTEERRVTFDADAPPVHKTTRACTGFVFQEPVVMTRGMHTALPACLVAGFTKPEHTPRPRSNFGVLPSPSRRVPRLISASGSADTEARSQDVEENRTRDSAGIPSVRRICLWSPRAQTRARANHFSTAEKNDPRKNVRSGESEDEVW